MATTGTPVFDALVLARVEIDMLKRSLTAQAAFVDTKTGATHGWTKGEGAIWSEETKSAAAVLAASMERDLAKLHFGTQPSEVALPTSGPAASGLGEHLSDSDGTRSV